MIGLSDLELTWVDHRMKRLGSTWIIVMALGIALSPAMESAQSAAKKPSTTIASRSKKKPRPRHSTETKQSFREAEFRHRQGDGWDASALRRPLLPPSSIHA